MKEIYTNNASRPGGHYSQAVEHNGLIFVAGQLPITASGEKITGSIEEQTKQVLKNLEEILKAAGCGLDNVLKTTVYISDMNLWGRVNGVYAEHFGEHCPARAVVPTRELHYGFLVELEAVAYTSE